MIPPIRKTITLPLPPATAFRLFTDDMFLWWPVETHSLSAATGERPRAVEVDPDTGLISETRADGTKASWAKITRWEPGVRLSLDWHVGRDPQEATQVDIRFHQDGDGTRIELTHSGFDRLADGRITAGSYDAGWTKVLEMCFGTFCQRRAA